MRRLLWLLPIAVALTAPGSAQADAKATFDAIVEAKLPPSDVAIDDAPKRIPAGESVRGFTVTSDKAPAHPTKKPTKKKHRAREDGDATVTISSDAAASSPAPCFARLVPRKNAPGTFEAATEAQIVLRSIDDEPGPVMIRREALDLSDPKHPSLALEVAWIDPKTLGARLVEASRVPLTLVRTGPAGSAFFAARSGNRVELVARSVRPASAGLSVSKEELIGTSRCGHLRVGLEVKEQGGAATASFTEDVELGAPDVPSIEREKDGEDDRPDDVRLRTLHVAAGLSWLSRDPKPVLSLSFGFLDRERVQRGGGGS